MANAATSRGDHRAGADDGPLPDGHPGKENGIDADVGPRVNAHRLDSRSVWITGTSIGRPVCSEPSIARARPHADVLLDDQVARVEVGLRSDPDVVAERHGRRSGPAGTACSPMKTPSPISKVSGCRAEPAAAESHAVADAACERAADDAPHHRIEVASRHGGTRP